jgi:hypothetical protein
VGRKLRRYVLLTGGALFVYAALKPSPGVCADGPVELEGDGYGGSLPAHLACGPDARIRFAGAGGSVGAHMGHDADQDGPDDGIYIGGGSAVEYSAPSLLRCDGSNCNVPGPSGQGGVGGRIGYDWSEVGVRLGGLLLWNGDGLRPWPDLTLRLGQVQRLHVAAGLGSYDIETLVHPGVWLGLELPLGSGWEITLHEGAHGNFGDTTSSRTVVSLRLPLSDRLWLVAGQAVWANNLGWGPETTLGIGGRL